MNILPALSILCLLASLVCAARWRDRSRPLAGEAAIAFLVLGWLLLAAEALGGMSDSEMRRALDGLAAASAVLIVAIVALMAITYGVVIVDNFRRWKERRPT